MLIKVNSLLLIEFLLSIDKLLKAFEGLLYQFNLACLRDEKEEVNRLYLFVLEEPYDWRCYAKGYDYCADWYNDVYI